MSKIVFPSPTGERPVRLSEVTRQLAKAYQSGSYGHRMNETPCVVLDEIPGIRTMERIDIHDIAIREIVKQAPLYIDERELLVGSAPLRMAREHMIPATLDGKAVFGSISHVTVGFEKALRIGLKGYEAEIKESMQHAENDTERRFLQSLQTMIDCMMERHGMYMDALAQMPALVQVRENLQNVPYNPPTNFREAVQALWFLFSFTRLCGNWSGIGRIDKMLGGFLKQDLESGAIGLDEARELLAHFWIKGCEWTTGDMVGSGDAQHYQNVVLAGLDENKNVVTNEVTYLVLDVVEELAISDYPIAVRINDYTDDKLYRRIAEVESHGGGVVAVYNERTVFAAMKRFGYEEEEYLNFANDGCWEMQVPGKTYFSYMPFDMLQVLQHHVLTKESNYDSFEELYQVFEENVDKTVDGLRKVLENRFVDEPCSVMSLFEEDCIARRKCYFNGGARYNVLSPHAGGIPDATNALYALRHLVWEKKMVTYPELIDILENNWEGHEELRAYVRNSLDYYGNDNSEVDELGRRVLRSFTDAVEKKTEVNGVLFPAGVSTFGRQIEWKDIRKSTPDGHRTGDVLANNFSPTPDTDKEGATAVIKSHCALDLSRLTTGTALDIKLYPTTAKGEKGVETIMSLLKGFEALNGLFMQVDVVDNQTLLDAQAHPENYQNLAVRISGWSARFVTLSKEWQDMIINRSSQKK